MSYVEIVKNYFSLLGAGEKDKLFNLIDSHAIWTIKGSDNVPTVGIWKGKEQISCFFERFSENFTPKELDILHYFSHNDKVFVIGCFTHFVNPTNKLISSDFVIEFVLHNNKITAYKILEDSYGLYLSFLEN